MPIKKLKVVSLFCGCGGSDLGMIGGFQYLNQNYPKLPFEIVYALDFDRWAVETYNKNFSHPAVCEEAGSGYRHCGSVQHPVHCGQG